MQRCFLVAGYRNNASRESQRPARQRRIVVAEWDRATRSMFDGIHLIERINTRGALIKVLDKPHLDLTTPPGPGLYCLLSAMAADERHRIVKRTNNGRAAARKRGTRFGRKPKLTGTSRPKHSSAWTPVIAVGQSPEPWRCITPPSQG
jgi:DNA invertase Pin-like site-specific DNA recombinase